jgi:hypothetical protein
MNAGNKATHDFLSLYAPAAKESSLPQLPGAKPPPTPPAQGKHALAAPSLFLSRFLQAGVRDLRDGFAILLLLRVRSVHEGVGRIFLEFAKFGQVSGGLGRR